MSYVPLGTQRFRLVQTPQGETLFIPARKDILILMFLSVWLAGWTIGGVAVLRTLFAEFQPFLAFWGIGWAIGWLMAAGVLSWMLTGTEVIRWAGRDLEVGFALLGCQVRRLYRGGDVRNLAATPELRHWQGRQLPPMPLLAAARGSVRFSYGARTRSFAFGADEAEAAAILTWLRKKVPHA